MNDAQRLLDSMQYVIPHIKDVTVERHYWVVSAFTFEAFLVQIEKLPDVSDREERIETLNELITEAQYNAIHHMPVPQGQEQVARDLFDLMRVRETLEATANEIATEELFKGVKPSA